MSPLSEAEANRLAAARLAGASEAVRRRNPHLFQTAFAAGVALAAESGTRVRQSHRKRSKLEWEAEAWLAARHPGTVIRWQAMTLVLGNGVRYTPDAFALGGGNLERPTAWEIKGPHAWDDALVKIKMAPTCWPDVTFILLWKDDGRWRQQTMEPAK